MLIILLTPNERGRVDRMVLTESHFAYMSSQVFHLLIDGFVLIVHEKCDDVIGGVR